MANETNRTAKKDARFFASLEKHGQITAACKAAGYSRSRAYEYRKADKDFAQQWDEADDAYVEAMEKEADRRALKGTDRPVFYQGSKCGAVREYSDTLLIFRLKGKRPEVYRDRFELTNDPNRPFVVTVKQF